MNDVEVRLLKKEDFDTVVKIDSEITGENRIDYYKRKFSHRDEESRIGTSLVALIDGEPVGFLLADLFYGEYGIPDANVFIDTIGVVPAFRGRSVGFALMDQLKMNLKAVNADKIYTLVDWSDFTLISFFQRSGFAPSSRISLECKI